MKRIALILTFVSLMAIACSDPDTYTVKILSITTYGNSGVGECFYDIESVGEPVYPRSQIVRPCGFYGVGDVVEIK